MIGAGSVVTKDVEDYALIVGNPGKQIGYVCKCGERIYFENNKSMCNACVLEYCIDDNKPVCK